MLVYTPLQELKPSLLCDKCWYNFFETPQEPWPGTSLSPEGAGPPSPLCLLSKPLPLSGVLSCQDTAPHLARLGMVTHPSSTHSLTCRRPLRGPDPQPAWWHEDRDGPGTPFLHQQTGHEHSAGAARGVVTTAPQPDGKAVSDTAPALGLAVWSGKETNQGQVNGCRDRRNRKRPSGEAVTLKRAENLLGFLPKGLVRQPQLS